MTPEIHSKSFEIETFLKRVLNIKDSKTGSKLKDAYRAIVWYENGKSIIKPAEHRKHYAWLLNQFEKAITKLASEQTQYDAELLKQKLKSMSTSEDILFLFEEVKKLKRN